MICLNVTIVAGLCYSKYKYAKYKYSFLTSRFRYLLSCYPFCVQNAVKFRNMKLLLILSLFTGAIALDFQGTGQLRALQGYPTDGRGTDLGCLDSQGQWTANEAECDIFSGTRTNNYTITLTTSAGLPCGRDNIQFVCQAGLSAENTNWQVSPPRATQLRDVHTVIFWLKFLIENKLALLWGFTGNSWPRRPWLGRIR